jgi:uncharacterized protein
VRTLFHGTQYQGIANTIVRLIGFLRFGPMGVALGERIVFPPDLLALMKSDIKEKRDGNSSNCDPSPFTSILSGNCCSKVRLAEYGWNSRDPGKVALAYAIDSRWRNRSEFISGRNEIIAFLTRKWVRELDYRLIKELWAFAGNRIAIRFAYEWHDDSGHWHRSYGNENWEFNDDGLMTARFASINDLPISESDRKNHWPLGRRPDEHPGLSELGL